jgi:hypothetical protein
MALIKIAIDRQNKTLVEYNGSVPELPPLYELNSQEFRVQVVDPTDDLSAPYEPVDCAVLAIRMVVSIAATGTQGDETENLLAAAYEAAWTWDAGDMCFNGEIDFNTAETAAYIGDAAFKTAILEVNLVIGGRLETLLSHRGGSTNFQISANCDSGGSEAPSLLAEPTITDTLPIDDSVDGIAVTDNVVEVTDLGLADTPSAVFIFINAPSGSGPIFCNLIIGSVTTDGFSFIMSGVPENDNYTFTYVLAF